MPFSVRCCCKGKVFEYWVYDEYDIGVIAYAKITYNDECVEINVINVNRDYRGRGIGSLLLERIINDHSDHPIFVETFEYLIRWYEGFGFELVCEKPVIMVRERGGPRQNA